MKSILAFTFFNESLPLISPCKSEIASDNVLPVLNTNNTPVIPDDALKIISKTPLFWKTPLEFISSVEKQRKSVVTTPVFGNPVVVPVSTDLERVICLKAFGSFEPN